MEEVSTPEVVRRASESFSSTFGGRFEQSERLEGSRSSRREFVGEKTVIGLVVMGMGTSKGQRWPFWKKDKCGNCQTLNQDFTTHTDKSRKLLIGDTNPSR